MDIRYTLDLTKLVMKPNPAGIELIERTGIDMSGIVVDGPDSAVATLSGKVFAEWVQCLRPDEANKIQFGTIYTNFQQYYLAHRGNDQSPVPTRVWLGKQLRKNEYLVQNQSGNTYVWGVALGGG